MLGLNKNTNKVDRETTDYTPNLNLLSFDYCEIIAPKRKSLKGAFNQFSFGARCMKGVKKRACSNGLNILAWGKARRDRF